MDNTVQDPATGDPDGDDRELLLEYLRHNNPPCPVCGYCLRELTHDVCPECGQRFRLTVGSVKPQFGMLLLCMVPMIMVSGLALLFAALVVDKGLPQREVWGLWAILICGVVDVVACVALYRARGWFFRASVGVQAAILMSSWLVHAGLVLASFMYGVR